MTPGAYIIAAALLTATMAMTAGASPRKRTTTRPRLERIVSAAPTGADTVAPALLDSIAISGYDKPLRSRRESIFVTNRTGRHLSAITVAIDYLDMQGRMLHHADIPLVIDTPPGETRQVTFPSWDRQLSFVYHRSDRSYNRRGTPYTVTVSIISALSPRE